MEERFFKLLYSWRSLVCISKLDTFPRRIFWGLQDTRIWESISFALKWHQRLLFDFSTSIKLANRCFSNRINIDLKREKMRLKKWSQRRRKGKKRFENVTGLVRTQLTYSEKQKLSHGYLRQKFCLTLCFLCRLNWLKLKRRRTS